MVWESGRCGAFHRSRIFTIPFFAKNFQVKPQVFTTWYFGGVSFGVAAWISFSGRAGDLLPGGGVILAIFSIGLTVGAVANTLLFQAIDLAPNPGLPAVIYSASSIVVFTLSAAFAARLPKFFNPVQTDADRFLGILLVLGGLFLIAGGWSTVRALFGKG